MGRLSPAVIVLLLVAQFPLALLPTATADHAADPNHRIHTGRNLIAGTTLTVLVGGSVPLKLVPDGNNATWRLDTADANSARVIRVNDGFQFRDVLFKGGGVNDNENVGSCRAAEATGGGTLWGTARRLTTSEATLFSGTVQGTQTADLTNVSAPFGANNFATVIPITTNTEGANGWRNVALTVTAEVICKSKSGDATLDYVDRRWTFTVNGLRVDNTLPDVHPVFTANPTPATGYEGRAIAKVGDTYTLNVKLNDTDFLAHRTICDAYAFSIPLSKMSNGTNAATFGSSAFYDGTACKAQANPLTLTVADFRSDGESGIDFDATPWFTGIRVGETKPNTRAVDLAAMERINVRVTDDASNVVDFRVWPRIDTEPPNPIVPTVTPKELGKVEVTWDNASLAFDAVDVKVEYSLDAGTTWKVFEIVNRTFNPSTRVFGGTGTTSTVSLVASPADVLFRATVIDDAGNSATSGVITKRLDPIKPSVALLHSDNTAIGNHTDHAFRWFLIAASDADGFATQSGESADVARVRLWRFTDSGAIRYWDNVAGSFRNDANVVDNKVTRVDDGSAATAALFNFTVKDNNLAAGTYYIEAYVKDKVGNEQRSGWLVLTRDTLNPTMDTTTSGANKIVFPAGTPTNPDVPQGAFLDVKLSAEDRGSGFKEVRFAFVRNGQVVTNVFNRPAIACLEDPVQRSWPSRSVAYARILDVPANTGVVCPPIAASSTDVRGDSLFACSYTDTSKHPCAVYTSDLCRFTDAATTPCNPSNIPSGRTNTTTPRVLVSTDTLPFGKDYAIEITAVDWTGRVSNKVLTQTFNVVPRVVAARDQEDTDGDGDIDVLAPIVKNGKLNLTVFAAFTDDADTFGASCPTTTAGPSAPATMPGAPWKTATCRPAELVLEYKSGTEWRPLDTRRLADSQSPETVDYSGVTFKRFGLYDADSATLGVRFFRYEWREWPLPAGVSLGDSPVLRAKVTASTTVGGKTEQQTALHEIVPGSTILATDLVPVLPLTSWSSTHVPTFYEPEGAPTRAAPDLLFKFQFQRASVASKNAMVYTRVYGSNMTVVGQTTGTTPEFTDTMATAPGWYYYRVAALATAAGRTIESPFSNEVAVKVSRTKTPGTVTWEVPTNAPSGLTATTVGANIKLTWTAPATPDGTVTKYRVYRGWIGESDAHTPPARYECDLGWPQNPNRPCSLVYWANSTADQGGNGILWSAGVNISSVARIGLTDGPGDWQSNGAAAGDLYNDHTTAVPSHTGTKAHSKGVFPWLVREVNLTRGNYSLVVTAHPKPSKTPTVTEGTAQVESAAGIDLPTVTSYGNFTRRFAVETRPPAASVASSDTFVDATTAKWTDRKLVATLVVDSRNYAKVEREHITVDVFPGSSQTSTKLDGVTLSPLPKLLTTTYHGDGKVVKTFEVTVNLPSTTTHGASYLVVFNVKPDSKTADSSSETAIGRASLPVYLDARGPTITFDLRNQTVAGGVPVDGTYKFHGKAEETGSGVAQVWLAVEKLPEGKQTRSLYWDVNRTGGPGFVEHVGFGANARKWFEVTPASGTTWSYEGSGATALRTAIGSSPEKYRLWIKAKDKIGNVAPEISEVPLRDAKPPTLGDNLTIVNTRGAALDFVWANVTAKDSGGLKEIKVFYVAPNGKTYNATMTSTTAAKCGVTVAAGLTCYTRALKPEMRWEGTYTYWYYAKDNAGNTWCSFGPCNVVPAENLTFTLTDLSAPAFSPIPKKTVYRDLLADDDDDDGIFFYPPIASENGFTTVLVNVTEPGTFATGYPQAVFYKEVDGDAVKVGNVTMVRWNATTGDTVAGFGLWAAKTSDAGVQLKTGDEICVVVNLLDSDNNFNSNILEDHPDGDLTGDRCDSDFTLRIVENLPPTVRVVSPTGSGTKWSTATPEVKFRVDDTNLQSAGITVTVQPENGTAIVDTRNLSFEQDRAGALTIGWNVTYRGGSFADGDKVTVTLGAKDDLSAEGTPAAVNLTVDAVAPTAVATAAPLVEVGDQVWVGPKSRATVSGQDSAGGSGLSHLEYRVNGGSWARYTEPVAATGGSTWTFESRAVDVAGNQGVGATLSYSLDRVAPTVAVVRPGAETTITAEDAASGVNASAMRLYYKTSAAATVFDVADFAPLTGNSYSVNLGALSGTFIFYVEVEDRVGNVGQASYNGRTCTADAPCTLGESSTQPPSITFVTPAEGESLSGGFDVKWEAQSSRAAKIRLTVADADDVYAVVENVTTLTGMARVEPATLGLPDGDWYLVLTIDDGQSPPVTARRLVTITTPIPAVKLPATLGSTQAREVRAGESFQAELSLEGDKAATQVVASIYRNNRFVRNVTFDVVDGKAAFSFSETVPGAYTVQLAARYADGTMSPPQAVPGTFVVRQAGGGETPDGLGLRLPLVLGMGALVVLLSASGAFWRWRK